MATTITGYGAASIESKGEIWLRFLALPRQLIPLFKARAKLNRPARESSTAPSLSAKEFIATSLARDGHVGKAASVLLREPVPDMPAGVMMKKLLELHPAGTFFTPLERQVDPWITVGADIVRATIRRGCSGAAPGPTGWTEELLKIANDNQVVEIELQAMLLDLLNNRVAENVMDHLRASRLVAIPKAAGGLRPIAVGEAIVRVAAAIALSGEIDAMGAHFGELQAALKRGGCEQVIHRARQLFSGGQTIIAVDFSNAFNAVKRAAIAREITPFKRITPLFEGLYGKLSRLLWRDTTIFSTEGARQFFFPFDVVTKAIWTYEGFFLLHCLLCSLNAPFTTTSWQRLHFFT